MTIDIRFTDQPIRPPEQTPGEGTGAAVEFRGIVRNAEAGAKISAIAYEIYEPMARRVITEIIQELAAAHPCRAVRLIHRHGAVPAGEASIFVAIESAHRGEAFQMLEKLMHRLKKDAPIWKTGFLPC